MKFSHTHTQLHSWSGLEIQWRQSNLNCLETKHPLLALLLIYCILKTYNSFTLPFLFGLKHCLNIDNMGDCCEAEIQKQINTKLAFHQAPHLCFVFICSSIAYLTTFSFFAFGNSWMQCEYAIWNKPDQQNGTGDL